MLTRIALRVAVQEALRGQTLAGDNVLDSQFTALDVGDDGTLRTDQDRPFLSVYTDGGGGSVSRGVFAFFDGGTADLVIEAGVSTAMLEIDPETGESAVVTGIPDTDAGFELLLDVMMRQAADALTDPDNAWAVCAAGLFDGVSNLSRARVGMKSGGARIAAQEVRLTGDLIVDPLRGQDLTETAFGQFLELLAASARPAHRALRERMIAVLAGTMTEWEAVRKLMGIEAKTLRAVGVGPIIGSPNAEPPNFQAGHIDVEGTGLTEVSDDP